MVFLKEQAIEIYNCLNNLNCCQRCIVRFLGSHVSEDENGYKNPKEYLQKFDVQAPDETSEVALKKIKRSPCPTCLNCFEDSQLERFAERLKTIAAQEYEYSNYKLNVSFPKCFGIRTHGMYLHLKKQFPDVQFCNLYDTDPNVCLELPHKIFRSISQDIFKDVLKKDYSHKSNLTILVVLGYDQDAEEVSNVRDIDSNKLIKFGGKFYSKKNNTDIRVSRNLILELLKNLNDREFTNCFPVPPSTPDKEMFVENVTIFSDPIYLGGRYLKFKRNVGQTPWIVDGVSLSEYNIQDIIFDTMCKIIKVDKEKLTFTSSGREDVDVRMLGIGRPFYIKIEDPKQWLIPENYLKKIEEDVIATKLAAVIELCNVYSSDVKKVKSGEEEQKKSYKALCHTLAPNIQDVVNIINDIATELEITQLTPLRVLHRRTLLPRKKKIYKMSASVVSGYNNLFELEIETQAGTYVKEFVHGDFSRTEPSISSLVGHPTDIIALDCIKIDLVWPEVKIRCKHNIEDENLNKDNV